MTDTLFMVWKTGYTMLTFFSKKKRIQYVVNDIDSDYVEDSNGISTGK